MNHKIWELKWVSLKKNIVHPLGKKKESQKLQQLANKE